MRIRIIILLTFTAIVGSLYSQIPNNGFENWTDMGSYSIPDGWGNLNPVTPTAVVYTCVKGTPGNPGAAYLKLSSRTVSGMGIQPGIAVSGVLNTTTFEAVSGFPYTDRPASLDGSWQYMAGGSDQGYIAVYLTKWNTGLNLRDTVGKFEYPLPGMVMSWRNFSLPLTYSSSSYPDSTMIILTASGKTPVNGSYLYIDNLAFAGGTVGMVNHTDLSDLLIFPNPVTQDKMIVDLKRKDFTAESVEIVDLHGKQVLRKTLTNQHFPVLLDISTLPSGEYFLRITFQGANFGRKFIKQ
jgi:hypothetical protein